MKVSTFYLSKVKNIKIFRDSQKINSEQLKWTEGNF